MTTDNSTPNLRAFLASDLELINAILALGEFVTNIDEEHPSYHLIRVLSSNIKTAHDNLGEHFTHEFESLFSANQRRPPKGGFHLFQVVNGGNSDSRQYE